MKRIKRATSIILAIACCMAVIMMLSSCSQEENGGQNGNNDSLFYVTYKDVRIELNKKADEVLEKLGAPQYEDNLGDCGGIGVQMKYTYGDIAINTLKEEKGEVVHKISFMNDLISTPKGIFIGSDEQDVRDAYGKPSSEENGKLIYKNGDLELEFIIKSGSVSAVNYRRVR